MCEIQFKEKKSEVDINQLDIYVRVSLTILHSSQFLLVIYSNI